MRLQNSCKAAMRAARLAARVTRTTIRRFSRHPAPVRATSSPSELPPFQRSGTPALKCAAYVLAASVPGCLVAGPRPMSRL